ncbi:MAG: metal-dependent hydrolase [Nitrospirae bacterium]|nr:MAG: metal-dependent hydrolase [Nitrospirota bacterium]
MDPVTHALSGAVLHQLGFKRRLALLVLVVSAVIPDIDYVTRALGLEAFLKYHRGITHGVFALALYPVLVGLLFRNRGGFFYFYALAFLGYGVHLLLDLSNQYGTMILSPLDWNRYSTDLIFIIDPYITLGFVLAVLLGRYNKKRAVFIAACTVILLCWYAGGRYYMQGQAKQFLKTKIDAHVYRVYPLPNGLLRWWFTVRNGDEITTGSVDLFMKKVFVYEKFRMHENDPAIAASKNDPNIKTFLEFAHSPYAEVKRDEQGATVKWKDLSYSFLPGEKFTATVVSDRNGKIVKSYFRF